MPHKICPKCNKKNGVRTKICECKYDFYAGQSPKKTKKTGKGNRVSKKIVTKLKEKRLGELVDCNWRELVTGDIIRIVGGGPYAVCKDTEGFHYVIPFSYEGSFKVDKLDNHGIHVYSSDGYHCYLYMGEEKDSVVGVLSPYLLKKIIPRVDK